MLHVLRIIMEQAIPMVALMQEEEQIGRQGGESLSEIAYIPPRAPSIKDK